MRVDISAQVREFVSTLAPEPRKKLREAVRMPSQAKGDIKPLVEGLAGFCRLRCGDFRVIYRHTISDGIPVVYCEFAERRDVVYQLFPGAAKDQSASDT